MTEVWPTDNAARARARDLRRSLQWRNVIRNGRTVSAERICTDCGEPIATDAELMAHWARHA